MATFEWKFMSKLWILIARSPAFFMYFIPIIKTQMLLIARSIGHKILSLNRLNDELCHYGVITRGCSCHKYIIHFKHIKVYGRMTVWNICENLWCVFFCVSIGSVSSIWLIHDLSSMINPLKSGPFLLKCNFDFILYVVNETFLYESWVVQWILNQHCVYWWPAA